jgi:hypothetical protein
VVERNDVLALGQDRSWDAVGYGHAQTLRQLNDLPAMTSFSWAGRGGLLLAAARARLCSIPL